MLGYVYGHGKCRYTLRMKQSLNVRADQALTANQDLGIKVATPAGTVFGQLIFGWLADVFGRKRMCMSMLSVFKHILADCIRGAKTVSR